MNKNKHPLFVTVKNLLGFLLFLISYSSFAQEITMQQTLDYINGKLAGRCSVDVSKGVIIAVYEVKGELVREDQVAVYDLDLASMKYDTENSIFFINCKGSPAKKCVNRQLFKLGPSEIYRPYARISWEAYLDEKGATGMKKAFTHMILLITEKKYKSSEQFE